MNIRKAIKKYFSQLSEFFREEITYHQRLAGYYELLPAFDWFAYTEEKFKDYQPNNHYKSILQRIRHYTIRRMSSPINSLRWEAIEKWYVAPSFLRKHIGSQLSHYAMKWV